MDGDIIPAAEVITPNKDVIEITKEILAQNRLILRAVANPMLYIPQKTAEKLAEELKTQKA